EFCVLPDHDLKVVECLLIIAQTEIRHRPSEPGIDIIRLSLELLVRRLKGSLSTFSWRLWFAFPTDHHVDEQLVAQVCLAPLEVALELVSIRPTRDGGCRGSSPDAAVSRASVGSDHGG